MLRKLVPAAALITANLLLVPPAMAVYWYTREAPLRVVQDGVTQGRAYGNFSNDNGVRARSYSFQQDARPGGDGVYVETNFMFYSRDTACGGDSSGVNTCWHSEGKHQTKNTTSGSWITGVTNENLVWDGEAARGDIKICENHGWAPDPCSSHVLRSFSY